MEKICWKITVAAFMQPLQYDLWSPAAKDNSITHAAKRGSNTCNPIYIAGTILQLQITMEFHRQLIHGHHLQSHLHCGNDPTVANHNGIPSTAHPVAPLAIPFTLRERSYSCKSQWNSVDRTCTKNSWNPIYNAEPIREWSENDPTTHETVSHPSHRRGRSSRFGDGLCMEKHRVSCICYLSKTHFVRDFLQNSIGNSSTSTTCNPIYIAETILQLQITMEFHRQLIHQHHLQSHLHCGNDPTVANHNGILSTAHARKTVDTPFTMRNRSEHDPRMIRPHTRPSRTRRTAEVDHRGSGTDFVWKNIGFRASAISQKRISCETSSKTPSATPPPAPLAIPFTLRKRSYSCKSQWNSIGNSSTSTTCNPIYIAGTILQLQITMEFCRPHMHEKQLTPHLQCGTDPNMIRTWSENDPTTHETVSHPSHRRGRSSRFGDGLCMEKHRVSCICYLSKTHFVRDFLQNSIGNSSTSTTCNAIYSEGTILQLQITMPWLTLSLTNSFFDYLFL